MKTVKAHQRILSAVTAIFFALNLVGVPASAAAVHSPGSASEVKVVVPFRLDIPPELGTIEKSISGQGPLIVHIQTAHGNYEAQKKIQAILHYLKDKYGIKLLLLEGTAFKLHPELLKLFPDQTQRTMEVLDELAKKALVKGPELFLAQAPGAEAYGIEDVGAYVKNGESFRAVLSKQNETETFLSKTRLQLERLMSTYLSKELRSLLKRQEDFDAKRIPLSDWISYLHQQARKDLDLDLADPAWQIDWPMFYRIIKLKEIEGKLGMDAYAKERETFLRSIDKKIPREIYDRIQSLLTEPLSHHQLPDPETGLLFEKMVSSLPINFDYSAYPNVKLFIGHLILQSELKADRLFDEMDGLIGKLSQKLAHSEREQKILELYKDYRLLEKLLALELTPKDYEEIESRISKPSKSQLNPSQIVLRLRDQNKTKLVGNIGFGQSHEWDKLFDRALEFYSGAKKRDVEMFRNIKVRLESTGQEKAVVVTGGFHAGPLGDHFQAEGASYVLITPKISAVDGRESYVKSILQYQIKGTNESTYESIPFLATSGPEMRQLGYDPQKVTRDIANFRMPSVSRSEMRSEEVNRALSALSNIEIDHVEEGNLLQAIDGAILGGLGAAPTRGTSKSVEEYLEDMKNGVPLVSDPDIRSVSTEFGIIDLSYLNHVEKYQGADAHFQLARDLHIAHRLGLITIKSFRGTLGPRRFYPFLKQRRVKVKTILTTWPDWALLKARYERDSQDANWIGAHKGDEKQLAYYIEVFGEEKAKEMHAGNLYSAIGSLIPRELEWQKLSLNLGDALKLRKDLTGKIQDANWIGAHKGDEKQLAYYIEVFGEEKAKEMHAGAVYSAIGSLIPRELEWHSLLMNLGDALKLRKDLTGKIQDANWIGAHKGDEKQLAYYIEVFGEEKAKEMHAGAVYSAIGSLIPRELEWHSLLMNLGDALKLRKDLTGKIQDANWIGAHKGDEKQLAYYIEVFGEEKAKEMHAGNLYSAIGSLIPRELEWHSLLMNLGDALKLRKDLTGKIQDANWIGAHKGDEKQLAYYIEVFGEEKAKEMHAGNLYSAIGSLIPRELEWHSLLMNLGDALKLRKDLTGKIQDANWIGAHKGDEKQLAYYIEVFGEEKAKEMHAGNLYSAIGSLIPRELEWHSLLMNLGDALKLRKDLTGKIQDANWIGAHKGDEKQLAYYIEVFGEEKAKEMHAGNLYSAIGSLIPRELEWQKLSLNLGDALKLRKDLTGKIQDANWIGAHKGDEKQLAYYIEVFGEEKAKEMHAGAVYSAIGSLIPRELEWHSLLMNLGDALKLRKDLTGKIQDANWIGAHKGDEKQLAYYIEVFGEEKAKEMHAGNLYSAIGSLIPRELEWHSLLMNLGDALKLRKDLTGKIQDANWIGAHKGDEKQLAYYIEVFGEEKAKEMHAGNLYSAIGSLIPRELEWHSLLMNLGDALKLRKDLTGKIQDANWIGAHKGDEKQLAYYIEVFGEEKAKEMHAGNLYSAIGSLIPRELEWQKLSLNLGDALKLRKDLTGKIQDANWIGAHKGDEKQLAYYIEVFGEEKAKEMHAGAVYSAIGSLIPRELEWQKLSLNLGDALKLRKDLTGKIQDANWIGAHKGDEKQLAYYIEVFGEEKAKEMHAGAVYSAIGSLIPRELEWHSLLMNLGDALKLRKDLTGKIQDANWIGAHKGDEKQLAYYIEVFGEEKAKEMHAGAVYSAIGSLIPRELEWHSLLMNLGDALKLRKDLTGKIQDANWIGAHKGDEKQLAYYIEVFGEEKAKEMHAGNLYSAIGSLIPRELEWHSLLMNLGDALKLRKDLTGKIQDANWIGAHKGDEKQLAYYIEVFGEEKAKEMHAGNLYSAIGSLIPRELEWHSLLMNLGDALKLRKDLTGKIQDANWIGAHKGDEKQLAYYIEVFGEEKAKEMHAGNLYSAIGSLIPRELEWHSLLMNLGDALKLRRSEVRSNFLIGAFQMQRDNIPSQRESDLINSILTPSFRRFFELRGLTIPLYLSSRFETRFLVDLLTELLARNVYSERAGILPATLHSVLDERLGNGRFAATDAFYSWMDAQAVDNGRALVDQVWIERLIAKSPRALYIFLSSLDKFQAKRRVQKPLVAVAGTKEILEQIRQALLRKDNGLNWEEKLEAEHFLQTSRLRELVELVSPDQVNKFIKSNNYGVAALVSGSESSSVTSLGAHFLLSPESIHEHDLVAVPFLIPALLKAAQLVRGVSDPHQQMLLLEASIHNILPGAQRQGQTFMIQLSQYIEQVMIREHLVEVSA